MKVVEIEEIKKNLLFVEETMSELTQENINLLKENSELLQEMEILFGENHFKALEKEIFDTLGLSDSSGNF